METTTKKLTKPGLVWKKSLKHAPANPSSVQAMQVAAIEAALDRSRAAIRTQYADRIVHPLDYAATIEDVMEKTEITIEMPFRAS